MFQAILGGVIIGKLVLSYPVTSSLEIVKYLQILCLAFNNKKRLVHQLFTGSDMTCMRKVQELTRSVIGMLNT